MKSAKIFSLKKFRLYGIGDFEGSFLVVRIMICTLQCAEGCNALPSKLCEREAAK